VTAARARRVPRVYLAGPEVFLPDPLAAAEAKKAICRKHGLEGVFPLDGQMGLKGRLGPALGYAIFRADRKLMDECDLAIANMTPFRGVSADVGTALEMGYMLAQGKIVLAYSNDPDDYITRLRRQVRLRRRRGTSDFEDSDGNLAEDFRLSDNLMLDGTVNATGGRVVRVDPPEGERFTCLDGFARCVRQAVRLIAGNKAWR
jgi:nucleoside 2-deoxyribosyltransferase